MNPPAVWENANLRVEFDETAGNMRVIFKPYASTVVESLFWAGQLNVGVFALTKSNFAETRDRGTASVSFETTAGGFRWRMTNASYGEKTITLISSTSQSAVFEIELLPNSTTIFGSGSTNLPLFDHGSHMELGGAASSFAVFYPGASAPLFDPVHYISGAMYIANSSGDIALGYGCQIPGAKFCGSVGAAADVPRVAIAATASQPFEWSFVIGREFAVRQALGY